MEILNSKQKMKLSINLSICKVKKYVIYNILETVKKREKYKYLLHYYLSSYEVVNSKGNFT